MSPSDDSSSKPSARRAPGFDEARRSIFPKPVATIFVGFSPKGQTAKLWLFIETKESFTAMNLLQFPIWSKKIQKFHEVPKKPKGNGCWR